MLVAGFAFQERLVAERIVPGEIYALVFVSERRA